MCNVRRLNIRKNGSTLKITLLMILMRSAIINNQQWHCEIIISVRLSIFGEKQNLTKSYAMWTFTVHLIRFTRELNTLVLKLLCQLRRKQFDPIKIKILEYVM